MSSRAAHALSLLILVAIPACDSGRQVSGAAPIFRDSAGVRIVRNLAPAWSGSPEDSWTISTEPILEIGVLEGDPALMFSQVRGVRLLSDRSIAVLDGGSNEIRIFDQQARHLRSFGGRGRGPGEFQFPFGVAAFPDDSVGVWDVLLRRLTIFAKDGTLGREVKLEESTYERASRPDFAMRLPNGDLLAAGSDYRPTPIPDDPQGLRWTKSVMLRYSSEGTNPRVIAETPQTPCDPGEPRECSSVAYGAGGGFSFHGDRVYAGRPDRNEISIFDETGRLTSVIYGSAPLEPVADALRAEFIAAVVAGDSTRQAERREFASRAQYAAVVPAYHSFRVDDVGNIWAREYRVEEAPFGYTPRFPPRTEGIRFKVYDPEGIELGDVQIPMHFNVAQIGADYVLGVGRDELDVQRVQMYALMKPQDQPEP